MNVGEGGKSDPNGANIDIPNHPTGVWVNDYTIQPENGGLSVFAHEFGHDLGLPDLYDTSGNTGGASNTVEHWSLMSQSRGTPKGDKGIGDAPMSFGAWEKLQLGWLNYKVVKPGKTDTVKVQPNSSSSMKKKAAIALLPDKKVKSELGEPCDTCGSAYYYSDKGDSLDNTMTRDVAGGGELTAKVRYEIEDGYDYAFLQASSDGGQTWADVETSESYDGEDQAGTNTSGFGISGTTDGQWVDLTATVRTHQRAALALPDRRRLRPVRFPGRQHHPRRHQHR